MEAEGRFVNPQTNEVAIYDFSPGADLLEVLLLLDGVDARGALLVVGLRLRRRLPPRLRHGVAQLRLLQSE